MREYHALYLEQQRRAELGIALSEQALTVNVAGGADDVWSPSEASNLTYCVSNEFGSAKSRMVTEMARATGDLEAAGNFDFIYDASQDSRCTGSNKSVVFAVRPWSSGGACAFFPSGGGCVRKTVVIDLNDLDTNPGYGNVSSEGVLRHELGHVLGLRHEHIRFPGTSCSENSSWRAVTAYDSSSMMHYPWCPGGTNNGDLRVTSDDATGIGHAVGAVALVVGAEPTLGAVAVVEALHVGVLAEVALDLVAGAVERLVAHVAVGDARPAGLGLDLGVFGLAREAVGLVVVADVVDELVVRRATPAAAHPAGALDVPAVPSRLGVGEQDRVLPASVAAQVGVVEGVVAVAVACVVRVRAGVARGVARRAFASGSAAARPSAITSRCHQGRSVLGGSQSNPCVVLAIARSTQGSMQAKGGLLNHASPCPTSHGASNPSAP